MAVAACGDRYRSSSTSKVFGLSARLAMSAAWVLALNAPRLGERLGPLAGRGCFAGSFRAPGDLLGQPVFEHHPRESQMTPHAQARQVSKPCGIADNDFWSSRRYQAVVSDDYALRDGCEIHSRRAA
jgi:hypothetical protein